jgi:membrane-bound lytic murein transglycosylase D
VEFNKWAVNGKVPAGSFTLFYVKSGGLSEGPVASQTQPAQPTQTATTTVSPTYKSANSYPKISGNTTKASQRNQILVNNLEGVQAPTNTTTNELSEEIGMREKRFLKLNDLPETEKVDQGAYYYTEKKRPSAEADTHVVETGETLWSISQKYGIRLASLKSKNRIRKDADLRPGMVLNLKEPRKRGEEIPVYQEPVSAPTTPAINQVTTSPVQSKEYTPSSPTESSHTVRAGETLFSISKQYGLSVEELKQLNGIGSQNLITVGQKLRILIR